MRVSHSPVSIDDAVAHSSSPHSRYRILYLLGPRAGCTGRGPDRLASQLMLHAFNMSRAQTPTLHCSPLAFSSWRQIAHLFRSMYYDSYLQACVGIDVDAWARIAIDAVAEILLMHMRLTHTITHPAYFIYTALSHDVVRHQINPLPDGGCIFCV